MSKAADSVIDLYQTHAAAWLTLRATALMERPWLERFLASLPSVPPGERAVLDLGCGTGQPIAGYLIENGCHITGVDGAAAMTDIARARFPAQRWITADMRDLPPLGRFHGLVAWHSFFHLTPEDQRPLFETFSRLALPGAALLFTSGTEQGEAIGTFEGQPLYHGSLDSAEYRQRLEKNGFEVICHVENDASCGGATIWLARKAAGVV